MSFDLNQILPSSYDITNNLYFIFYIFDRLPQPHVNIQNFPWVVYIHKIVQKGMTNMHSNVVWRAVCIKNHDKNGVAELNGVVSREVATPKMDCRWLGHIFLQLDFFSEGLRTQLEYCRC